MAELDPTFERDNRFLDYLDFIRDGKWVKFTVTVAGVFTRNHFQNEKDKKPIDKASLQFKETKGKVLLMNDTNSKLAMLVLGDCHASKVNGKRLTLHAVSGKWSKGNYGVRVLFPEWKQHGIQAHHMGINLTGESVNPDIKELVKT
jgi:hypothetical protein